MVGGCKMDKMYVLLLLAAKPSVVYVALSKTNLEKASHTRFPYARLKARKCRPRCTLFRRGIKPIKLRTDKGVEFRNRDVQHLLKVERMDHLYTQNEQKSSYAERCIKTLKAKLVGYLSRHQTHYWIDVLQRKLSSFHQDGSPSSDQERRSPFVETPVHHQTVRQDTDTTLRVPERRHRLYLARDTTVRSGLRTES